MVDVGCAKRQDFIYLKLFSPSVTAYVIHRLGCRLGRCFSFAEVSAGHPHPPDTYGFIRSNIFYQGF